ncbi:hypothetical protein TNCV_1702561 [Trichonephila clavipes]|nr:hypothetical protein TNCV_1702561 [Trichonephila clavipes]
MYASSSSVNPTPLAHADTPRDILPMGEYHTVNEKMPGNDEDIEVEETVQTPNISHSERLRAVETTFQVFEQRGASVMDLLFLRRVLMKQQNADCSTKDNGTLCIPLKKKSSQLL